MKSSFRILSILPTFLFLLLMACAGGMHEGPFNDAGHADPNKDGPILGHVQGSSDSPSNSMEGGAIGSYSDPSESGGGGASVNKDDLPNLKEP